MDALPEENEKGWWEMTHPSIPRNIGWDKIADDVKRGVIDCGAKAYVTSKIVAVHIHQHRSEYPTFKDVPDVRTAMSRTTHALKDVLRWDLQTTGRKRHVFRIPQPQAISREES